MKNLKLMFSLQRMVSSATQVQFLAVNSDNNTVYCATDCEVFVFHPETGKVVAKLNLADVSDPMESKFVGIYPLLEDYCLFMATSTGDILLWNLETLQVDCVGSIESGITAVSWSPDAAVVVLTTGAETFIIMTREFDPVCETSLHPEQVGEAEFVQVGWGKKETQFHGSVGKQAAQVSSEVIHPALPWDDRKPRIAWRSDGHLFAISSIHPITRARKICVWTREGVHHSTSENVNGIEQALSWKPNGCLVTTSQRRPNAHDIAFFEKNGLRHGEFTLPFNVDEVKVQEVSWNTSSTILAVWCEDLNEQRKHSYVLLWTTRNYHWYLKQCLHFQGNDSCICAFLWDPEKDCMLHVMCSNGRYLQYTFSMTNSHSDGRSKDDQALVAVIDGAKVLLTAMKHMVVPPPMSSYYLKLPTSVNQVLFFPMSNDMAMVLADNKVAIYKFMDITRGGDDVKVDAAGGTGFRQCCPVPSLSGIYNIVGLPHDLDYPLSLSHFTWISPDDMVLFTVAGTSQSASACHKCKLEDNNIKVVAHIPVESRVFNTAFDPVTMCLVVQLEDRHVLKYNIEDELMLPWETSDGDEVVFPDLCVELAVCTIGDEIVVIGRTKTYRLFINNIEIANNCTSFSVHDEFLLLTTHSHTCRCINRHTKFKDILTLSDGKVHPFDESIRKVERGSEIVISVADDTKLVLQMPRGNLETIHPRALVLSAVRKHLDKLNFLEAFIIMRKHRINMNLIYDHNPDAFLRNVQLFVQQVAQVSYINLFLTDLIEDDVTLTMYTAAYERNKTSSPSTSLSVKDTSKICTVCDALRVSLINEDENKYLLSILTTYVKKTKPELEQALQLIKKLRDRGNKMPHITAEEALKYLLFLVDVNELYDVALGTYNFDLVMMVAEKSQKDPKEYLPFLNQLRKLDTNYQKYTIDKYLKKYDKALENISKCGLEFMPECLSLINAHHLHTSALQLFPSTSPQYKEIANSYGEILSSKRHHDEAALMFVKGGNWEMALQSYIACHQWQQVFCMTSQLKYSPEQQVQVARKLADELKSRNRHGDAAVVLEQYAQDAEEAIVTLVRGCLWDEALRLMHKYRRTDFIDTNLKPQLLESFESHLSNLNQMQEQFCQHKTRLGIVRQEKHSAKLLEYRDIDGVGNVQDSDLFSDTSSATGESTPASLHSASTTSTLYSKMSGRSTKSRRKAEHKKWRLKEGSKYEDYALIAALANIIKYIDSLRDDIKSLVQALVMFNYDKQGVRLQQQYASVLILIDQSIPQIWPNGNEDQEFKPVLGSNTTANAIVMAMQQGRPLQSCDDAQEEIDPVIKFAPILQKEKKWKLYALET